MPRPNPFDFLVDSRCFFGGLDPQRIVVIVPVAIAGAPQMNHRVISLELLVLRRPQHLPEKMLALGPVGEPVQGPAVTKRGEPPLLLADEPFARDLRLENRDLGLHPRAASRKTPETASVDNRRRLWKNRRLFANQFSQELENGRLPCAGPPRQNDEFRVCHVQGLGTMLFAAELHVNHPTLLTEKQATRVPPSVGP